MLLSLVMAVALSVLAVFFANENQAVVQLQMLGLNIPGKLGIIVVIAFGLGAVVGILVMLPAYLSQGWSLIRSRRKVEDLEAGLRSAQTGNTKQV
ncbi:MAG TPA: LapA family protein [Anaerolineales bacterium]